MPIKFANTYVKSYSYYPKAFRFISMMRYDFDKRSASEKYEIALLTTDEKSDSYEYTYFYGNKYIDEKPVTHIFDEYWNKSDDIKCIALLNKDTHNIKFYISPDITPVNETTNKPFGAMETYYKFLKFIRNYENSENATVKDVIFNCIINELNVTNVKCNNEFNDAVDKKLAEDKAKEENVLMYKFDKSINFVEGELDTVCPTNDVKKLIHDTIVEYYVKRTNKVEHYNMYIITRSDDDYYTFHNYNYKRYKSREQAYNVIDHYADMLEDIKFFAIYGKETHKLDYYVNEDIVRDIENSKDKEKLIADTYESINDYVNEYAEKENPYIFDMVNDYITKELNVPGGDYDDTLTF